jgi:RNA polymerase sigma factor (sigma-70 family)
MALSLTMIATLGSARSALLETPDVPETLDRALVRRLRNGDEDAFRDLFARHAPSAKALALRVVRQTNLAEEIVQEAFLAVWRNPDGYDDQRGSVRSWLMGTVHHRAVDLVRREEAYRRRAEDSIASAVEEQGDHADEVAVMVDRPGERRAVLAALAALPPPQREVLEMMYFDGLSQSRIAERTGLPLGTVKSRTLLAMRRLRAALEGMRR